MKCPGSVRNEMIVAFRFEVRLIVLLFCEKRIIVFDDI